jgi:hypothetical protein
MKWEEKKSYFDFGGGSGLFWSASPSTIEEWGRHGLLWRS